ncbi:MAG: DUF3576 domain-containing protein [Pseudomonadota bacterium]
MRGYFIKGYFSTLCVALLITTSSYAQASEYPKTRAERRADEMGSILGGEGLVFRANKTQNEVTKSETDKTHSDKDRKNNNYLWEAALDELSVAPLLINDKKLGVISTDWYSEKENPNHATKTTVKIISLDESVLEITMKQRVFQKGRWLEIATRPSQEQELEAKILRKSKELHINAAK